MSGLARRASAWGAMCGVLAAFCYGTNPLGVVPLYRAGLSPETVILYRTGLAVPIVAAYVLLSGGSFRMSRRAFGVVVALGALFAASSLSFYAGMRLMDVGVACTLLFVYPILTAATMVAFFGEKLRVRTVVSMALAFVGAAALCLGGGARGGVSVSGVAVTFLSALTYALYIVVVNRADLRVPVATLTFWALSFCSLFLAAWTFATKGAGVFVPPHGAVQWGCALFIAVVPTLLSLALMACSVRRIGSTATSVLGALEPLTAVAVGVFVFGEPFTTNRAIGLVTVLAAVLLILVPSRRDGGEDGARP